MAIKAKGLLSNKFALSIIIFSILVIVFVVLAILNVNIIADTVVLVLMFCVGIFGILPHAFEEM